jgi:uncharacterized protein (TIGR02300 family)
MPKEEWGTKRICPTTGRRFYDLNKKPIVSPYTGETVTLDQNTRTRVAAPEKEKVVEEEVVLEEPEDLAEGLLAEDDDTEADASDDLLEDDDDDVSLDEIADVAVNDDD